MYGGIGDAIERIFWCLLIFLPFGVWKVIELVWWLVKHIHIG